MSYWSVLLKQKLYQDHAYCKLTTKEFNPLSLPNIECFA